MREKTVGLNFGLAAFYPCCRLFVSKLGRSWREARLTPRTPSQTATGCGRCPGGAGHNPRSCQQCRPKSAPWRPQIAPKTSSNLAEAGPRLCLAAKVNGTSAISKWRLRSKLEAKLLQWQRPRAKCPPPPPAVHPTDHANGCHAFLHSGMRTRRLAEGGRGGGGATGT